MLCPRVQYSRKVTMLFKLKQPRAGNPVDRGAISKIALTDRDVIRFEQPLDAPVEACPGVFRGRKLHHFKQLLVGDEPGIAHLEKQRNIAAWACRERAFGIEHVIPSS